jgi:hypothetical protein
VEQYPFAFLNPYIQSLFIFTAMTVATLWFAGGHLNAFISAVLNILLTGLGVTLSFFLFPVIWPLRKISAAYSRIHFTPLANAGIFLLVGVGIILADHFFSPKLFAEDETLFYSVVIMGKKYWATVNGLLCGASVISFGILMFLNLLWSAFMRLLDRRIRITFIMTR